MMKTTNRVDQLICDVKDMRAQLINLVATLNGLDDRLTKIEEVVTRPKLNGHADWWTVKSMAAEVGAIRNKDVAGMLRFYAKQYCLREGVAPWSDETKSKQFERFPPPAAEYAMNRVREQTENG